MNTIEMVTHEGTCKYCGQVMSVLAADQYDANTKISDQCECGGAAREARLNTMKDNIKAVIGEKAIENGFQPVSEKQYETIMIGAMAVFDQHIEKVAYKLGVSTITIQITGKGAVKVSRAVQKNISAEA